MSGLPWVEPAHDLTLEAAQQLCRAALAEANRLGIAINVAVVDSRGILLNFARMPGAFIHSIDIAIDKAYTAAGFQTGTQQLADMLAGENESVRSGLRGRPRLIAFGGGEPVRWNGVCVGAIGVSGGSVGQDLACVAAALEQLGTMA